ncbi:MAG: glycosyltransferase family 2 protein [Magnetococcales bacterium]|nr:glycosyltransferase family 2 protein [Magnetococcales bacterium]
MILTVLVPVYNEAGTILEILAKVRDQRLDGVELEVLVVDDGSTDATPRLLAEHPQLYDRLIRMPVNGGKGAAVREGIRQARGGYILFQDADLEYDPADYVKMVFPVLKFGATLVVGSRFSNPDYTRVFYYWHKVGNWLITLFFNLMFNTTFTDIYTCYVLFKKTLIDPNQLGTNGWEQHAEILSTAMRQRCVAFEVPINYNGRTYEDGKKIRWHHIFGIFRVIFRVRLFG